MDGAADHFVEGGSGGDHGVDAVFFFYLEVDEGGLPLVRALVTVGMTSVRLLTWRRRCRGQRLEDEVGREDGRRGVVLVVERLLPLADHAEEAVVDDGDVDGEAFLLDGGQFGGGHLEASVAGDDPEALSGQATLAPMAAGRAKPMVPRPPEVMRVRGVSCLKYWASHIWCWPTSVTMMVFSRRPGRRLRARCRG